MKTLFAVLVVACALLLSPLSSGATTALILDKTAVDSTFLPHTVVFPDCQAVPIMTILSACAQTSETIAVYGLLPGTCENYSESISARFPDADTVIQPFLEDAPLVFYDTAANTALPHDLSIAAGCAGFGATSQSGGGSGGGGGGGDPDLCPDDPSKTAPGLCGCGVSDVDSDADNIPDCHDGLPNTPIARGDLNNDGSVDLTDAITAMQALVQTAPSSAVYKEADLDNDDTIGLEDVIHILQKAAGAR